MTKQAQVTIFIIIGLMLVAGAAVTIYLSKLAPIEEVEIIAKVPTEVEPIYNYIDNCIKSSTIPAVRLMGSQGGFILMPDDFFSFEGSDVAYLYDKGENKVPSLLEMEAQLELYLDNTIPECVDFAQFEEQGFEITPEDLVTTAKINLDNIVFDVTYPVTLTKADFSTEFSQFRHVSNLRLGRLHSIANDLVERLVEDPQFVDMTYLETFGLEITVIPGAIDSFLYSIKDDGFLFLFANRFVVNNAPEIRANESFRIKDNSTFEYQVEVIDEGEVVLEDDTAMFDISQDGWIRFTPDVIGTFDVMIIATDEQGEITRKEMRFVIEE